MVTMYSTQWCGYCHRLKSQLEREGIGHSVVDIEDDLAAAQYVMGVNGGNRTVPTVRFADGSSLTNPTIIQVKEHLIKVNTTLQKSVYQPGHDSPTLEELRPPR